MLFRRPWIRRELLMPSPWVTPTLVAAGPTACPRRWAATSRARTTRPSSRRAGSCAARRWRTSPRPSASALRSCAGLHRQVQCRLRCRSRCLWPQPREDGSFGRWHLTTPSSLRLPLSTPAGGLTTDEYGRTLTWRNERHPPFVQRGQHRQRRHLYAAYRRQRLLGPGRRGDQQHRRAGAVGL